MEPVPFFLRDIDRHDTCGRGACAGEAGKWTLENGRREVEYRFRVYRVLSGEAHICSTGHSAQLGLRAVQQRRPWKMIW